MIQQTVDGSGEGTLLYLSSTCSVSSYFWRTLCTQCNQTKHIPLKMLRYEDWSGKKRVKTSANIQRKTLKDLQKTQRTVTEDHFTELQESLAFLEAKYKEMRGTWPKTSAQHCVDICGHFLTVLCTHHLKLQISNCLPISMPLQVQQSRDTAHIWGEQPWFPLWICGLEA